MPSPPLRTGTSFVPFLITLATPFCLAAGADRVDFNRDVRPILSNYCFACHGPDEQERQADLRLDTRGGTLEVIEPGDPQASELVRRLTAEDPDERMPPASSGKTLSPREIQLLLDWVQQGADYAQHWSYVKPERPPLPQVKQRSWPRNELDHFLLARLERERLDVAPEADRYALARRLSLDLTGLPPTVDEVDRFVQDRSPRAYEDLVDRLLKKKAYGEHWARMWLDLARYADSAGYADDPPRTIWAYRDYVIRSLNENKPFDQFTIEQVAGDLLPDPTGEQLIATAFHRNTLTNNEGGTSDEEFRNVAVVDRVNTTMAVWMGTTMACAQCHTHKYDPITQEEYFRMFAIFNNTEDADRRDESPLLQVWSAEQQRTRAQLEKKIQELQSALSRTTPQLREQQKRWEERLRRPLFWTSLAPTHLESSSGAQFSVDEDHIVRAVPRADADVYSLEFAVPGERIRAVRLEALPDESLAGGGPGHAKGNFAVSKIGAAVALPEAGKLAARYVRIEIPGPQRILSLAEVQVFSGGENIARGGKATQSSTDYNGPAQLAVDGNTNGHYFNARSTTHTRQSNDPWWQVDLLAEKSIDRIVIWNRTDGSVGSRLANFRISVLDAQKNLLWRKAIAQPPRPDTAVSPSGVRTVTFASAYADFTQTGFDAGRVISEDKNPRGWAIAPRIAEPHWISLVAKTEVKLPKDSRLRLTIQQQSGLPGHTLGRFRVLATDDVKAAELARIPPRLLAVLRTAPDKRNGAEQAEVDKYYRSVSPTLAADVKRLAQLKKQLAGLKPVSTVPIMRERSANRRTTNVQHRGSFLDTGKEVTAGLPSLFSSADQTETVDRLVLARWLVDSDNPLTPRVIANRYWEAIFGTGIVPTSEEFGSQGQPPTHPELLDWLAVELVASGWDIKGLLRKLVTSAAYRQSSRVTPELVQRDPQNLLMARGPRFRLSAESVRDQALFVGGLLSSKMYGPPAKPPQPSLGLKAAFGSGIDWKTSSGEDRYRRGLYTTWRRSNPYPSMVAFDAPNREVCTIRRDRTNTPLQALVTLNDPVYVEAAQGLGRRMGQHPGDTLRRVAYGFRICLARPPQDDEAKRLANLYQAARQRLAASSQSAKQLATVPIGALPEGLSEIDAAAWTVVANVMLNLDEMFMKR